MLSSAFTIAPSWPLAERVVEQRLRLRGVGRADARDRQLADDLVEVALARVERLVDEVDAVAVQDVEEPHEQERRRARGAVAAERAHGVLERLGRGVLVDAEHLAVEHDRRHR